MIWRGDEGSHYSYRWNGFFTPTNSGSYCFWTNSDDASAVRVNSGMVTNNLGAHGMQARTGCKTLSKGVSYNLEITFGERTGGAAMQFKYRVPGSSTWHVDLDSQFTVNRPTGWRACSHLTCKMAGVQRHLEVTHHNAERHGAKHKCTMAGNNCNCLCSKGI